MKLLTSLLLTCLITPAPPADDPVCTMELTLPQSALKLTLEYKQIGGDPIPFREHNKMTPEELKKLQVAAMMHQGARFSTDVNAVAGEDAKLEPGKTYALGYTIGSAGNARLFLVVGQEAVALPSEALTPAFKSERFTMQLVYVNRNEARLQWHVADKAGFVKLKLGSAPLADPAAGPDAAGEAGATKPAEQGPKPAEPKPGSPPPAESGEPKADPPPRGS